MRIESNCQTGEIKYFDDADNEIDPPVLEEGNEPLPADEQPSAAEQPAED